jgi:hypothetical protein
MITMLDTAWDDQFLPGADAYAGYVDGDVGSQPNYEWLTQAYPSACHLSIALFPADNADCLDIEPGAATAADAAEWYERQVTRGVHRPCFYADADTMERELLPVVRASGFPRDQIRLWSAHYGAGEHICGPSSCQMTSVEMDGTQWTDSAGGRDLDQSLLLPGFFDPPPVPDPRYGPPGGLTAVGGRTTVKLSWGPPAPVDGLPAASEYTVFIYAGGNPTAATIVKSYPRVVGDVLTYQGGSLKRGRMYTAHVVAAGPDGAHVKPFTYASASFATG